MFVQFPINNIDSSISKPVIMQILNKIKNDIFYDRNSEMLYIDYTGSATEVGSTLTGYNQNDLRLETESKIIATAVERANNDIILTSIVDMDNAEAVWYDRALKVTLRPTRIRSEVTINLRYKAASKQEVNNWLNYYYNRLARGVVFTSGEVAYEYAIPDGCIAILEEIWKKRELVSPYGDSFLDYLDTNFLSSHALKTNIRGRGATLVVQEILTNLVVSCVKEMPESTRLEAGNYEAEIELTFSYEKPTTLLQNYPIFVHNNYLDAKFIDMTKDHNADMTHLKTATNDLTSTLTALFGSQNITVLTDKGYVYPRFDDTLIDQRGLRVLPIIQMQLAIDQNDPTLLADLSTLESDLGIEFHAQMLPYIYGLGDNVLRYGRGAIFIGVYRDGQLINPVKYHLDENLQIRSNYNLNLRGRYHLAINVLYHLDRLNVEAITEIANYGDFAISLIKFLAPNINDRYLPVPVKDGGVVGSDDYAVSTGSLYDAIEKLPQSPMGITKRMFTVNTLVVTV